MSNTSKEFYNSNLQKLGYTSRQDIIENLYIDSLKNSYIRLNKKIGVENEIRDRFRDDLYYNSNSELKKWLQLEIIYLDWEDWSFAADKSLRRTDFVFKLSGFKFVVECKRLKYADKKYIEQGLERFITLIYAETDVYVAMMGFVTAGDKKTIAGNLRTKISTLKHTNKITKVSTLPSFESNHTKSNNLEIDIYHLFFEFSLS